MPFKSKKKHAEYQKKYRAKLKEKERDAWLNAIENLKNLGDKEGDAFSGASLILDLMEDTIKLENLFKKWKKGLITKSELEQRLDKFNKERNLPTEAEQREKVAKYNEKFNMTAKPKQSL